jgi:hypothetical protein
MGVKISGGKSWITAVTAEGRSSAFGRGGRAGEGVAVDGREIKSA